MDLMTVQEPSYDVAFPFCNNDLGLATELRDKIGGALDVFVYSSKQEELAGTDGLQTFRATFERIQSSSLSYTALNGAQRHGRA